MRLAAACWSLVAVTSACWRSARRRRERGAVARGGLQPRGPDLRRRRARRRDGSPRPTRDVRVDVDGTDVTSAFAVRPNGRFEGLVTGLKVGANTLTVRDADGAGKRITITNHPIGGPVFAGPQVTPYACNPNASNPPLGPATRRAVQRADAGRAAVPQRGQPVRRLRPGQPARAGASRRRRPTPADRAVHRPARHRHRRPRHLPDGRARRPGASRSRRGRPSSRGAASSSTRSAARAAPSTASSRPAACCRRRQLGARLRRSPPRA